MSFKLTHSFTEEQNFRFTLISPENESIRVESWFIHQDEFLAQFQVLLEMVDNGFAEVFDNFLEVECIEILKLSETTKLILGLPNTYPFEIYVQSNGLLHEKTFKYQFGFFDFAPNGSRFIADRAGALVTIEGNAFLLSENHYKICQALDDFNNLPESEKTTQINFIRFLDIKSLAKDSAVVLDSYLENQKVLAPETIQIGIDYNNGVLECFPEIVSTQPIPFGRTFDLFPQLKDAYPVPMIGGERVLVILSEEQKKGLKTVKSVRKTNDPELIQRIVENPEHFFDPEIDFSVFYSERVKEIGIYKPKFYPFASPYKSEWIPSLEIRDRVAGIKVISVKNQAELEELIQITQSAEVGGEKAVYFKGEELPLEVAKNWIEKAKKQLKSPQENQFSEKEEKKSNPVLIIHENAEDLGYTESGSTPSAIVHDFQKITSLSNEIQLKNHQEEGISWMQTMFRAKQSGCLLADDMGLGKTLQLLYFIEWHSLSHPDQDKPYLIVAPVSLLENWEKEYQKFFHPQAVPVTKLYGSNFLTKEFNLAQNKEEAQILQKKQIILINYEVLRIYQATFGMVDFAVIVLDEAQKIKSPGTLITNACKALKADFKIAMTGTPVENTLVDIWCIMDFCSPGLLGNAKDFAKEFQSPLKNEGVDVKELTENLRARIGVFIKRRLKKDVAKDLPTKHDNELSRTKRVMPLVQLERYKQEIELASQPDLNGVEGRNQRLKSLWAIKDISDHPFLVDRKNVETEDSSVLIEASAKLKTTIDLLHEIRYKGEKAIIFAERKSTQKMLQKVIKDTFQLFASIINGDTPATAQKEDKVKLSRQQTIDRFQSELGFHVIIMSPLAAGVGLNVTEANHVIHYSRHWNPAKEEQATDRAYRIGQTKDVYVYYPMAIFPEEMKDLQGNKLASFDEILDNLLVNKKALASSTLFPTEQAEVRPDELFGNVFGIEAQSQPKRLTIQEMDCLNPNLFEAAVAALYQHEGFEVQLTPNSNDKGADVVLLRGDADNFLIQAKQSVSPVGGEAIQEIVGAKRYYENTYRVKFNLLVVTNSDFTHAARTLAEANDVNLIHRNQLVRKLEDSTVVIQAMHKLESQRLDRI